MLSDAEDSDEDLAYQPPQGAVLIDADVDTTDFDWDELKNNEDLELWVMRMPENVRSYAERCTLI